MKGSAGFEPLDSLSDQSERLASGSHEHPELVEDHAEHDSVDRGVAGVGSLPDATRESLQRIEATLERVGDLFVEGLVHRGSVGNDPQSAPSAEVSASSVGVEPARPVAPNAGRAAIASVYATWTVYVGPLPEMAATHHNDGEVSIPVSSAPTITYLHGTVDEIDAWLDAVRQRNALERRRQVEARMEPLGGEA